MSQQVRVKLFLLVILLGALAGVLGMPATQVASAAPPCEYCDYKQESCLNGTCCSSCAQNATCCQNLVASCYAFCWDRPRPWLPCAPFGLPVVLKERGRPIDSTAAFGQLESPSVIRFWHAERSGSGCH
jgi:hypothetical protein